MRLKIRLHSYLTNLVLSQLQKESWKNINCSRSYKALSNGQFEKKRYWSRYLKKCDQNSQLSAQNRPTAIWASDLLIGITRPCFIWFWYFFIARFFETNIMMTHSNLHLLRFRFFWPHFCSEASYGQHCVHGPKTNLKISWRVLAFPINSYLKIEAAIFMFVTCKLSVKV